MAEYCEGAGVECVERFARIESILESHGERLEKITKALTGNGDTRGSMTSRMAALEQMEKDRDRVWKVIAAVSSIAAIAVSLVAAFR